MFTRLVVAFAAIAAAHAQITVEVAPTDSDNGDTDRRYTQELLFEFNSAREDALLLFTEFTATAGADLRLFIQNIATLTNETIDGMSRNSLDDAPQDCRSDFEKKLKKIEYDAHRFASFSAENHHKFFLGHMIVFKMHLNKTEDYLKKCEKVIEVCGSACETTPRIVRWRRLAKQEIARVRDDLHHSKLSYQDLLVHYRRRLNHLKKQATTRAQEAVDDFQICIQGR